MDSGQDYHRAYEALPYTSKPYASTHPARLGVIGALFGMTPAPPATCRVLELGCAAGWNLLSMAAHLPDARFVGVDVAAGQIAEGEAARRALGLDNVTLRTADLETLDGDLGAFDYVIAHGLYSWVPERVRDRLLALVREHLSPQGLAFVSFNCLPGWHDRLALRDMMLYHTRDITEPAAKTIAAMELLEFLAEASPPHESSYKLRLQEELEALRASEPEFVFHDHLAPINDPVYFKDFAGHAAGHGLAYVGDAVLRIAAGRYVPPELVADLEDMSQGDRLVYEQYLDFVLGRSFRKAVLCRDDVTLARTPEPERLRAAFVSSPAVPTDPDPDTGATRWTLGGRTLTSAGPAVDELLHTLAVAWPRAVAADDLFAEVAPHYPEGDDETRRRRFDRELLDFCGDLFVDLATHPLEAGEVGERPATSPLVRYELAAGRPLVSASHHRYVALDPPLRLLAELADGTRDFEALLADLRDALSRGELALPVEEATPEQIDEGLAGALARGLVRLEHLGLLA